MIKLSILVPTVPSRISYFYPRIMSELLTQTKNRNDIEIIALFDNKKRTIGRKRQEMLDLAQGEYTVFLDDDDRITNNFVEEIMSALYANPDCDCVVYNTICSVNGQQGYICKYGIEYDYHILNEGTPQKEWRGRPAHTMVYKSSISKKHKYNDVRNGEDVDWVKRAYIDIKKQVRIDKVLYYYDANYTTTSETASLPDHVIQKNIDILLSKDK
jgi:glycosyltransferase involved in cell wall biosynthesis